MGRKSGLKKKRMRLKSAYRDLVVGAVPHWDPEEVKIFLEKTWKLAKMMHLEEKMFDEIEEYEEGGDLVLGEEAGGRGGTDTGRTASKDFKDYQGFGG